MKKFLIFLAGAITIVLCLLFLANNKSTLTNTAADGKFASTPPEAPIAVETSREPAAALAETVHLKDSAASDTETDEQSSSHAAGQSQVLLASNGGTLGLQMPPLPRGKAKLELEDREVIPENLNGHYQRVLITGESITRVVLQWPGIGADRPVFVHAIHGGKINGKSGDTFYTTGDGELAFNFTSSPEAGRSEVLLRSGPSEEVLHFWTPVGAPEIDRFGL